MSGFLTLINANELFRFSADSLVYVSSDGNYSEIVTRDGAKRTVTVQLGVIEELLNRQLRSKDDEFMRIGKSLIVNVNFVHYINPVKKQIVLSDSHTFSHSLEASKEALKQLKDFFENNVKK